jgi:hypothetical protein
VGIINYLPLDNERQRQQITELFTGKYCDLLRDVGLTVNATSHWAKLERPSTVSKLIDLQLFLQQRYPVKFFNDVRYDHDPHNILGNPLIDLALGAPRK